MNGNYAVYRKKSARNRAGQGPNRCRFRIGNTTNCGSAKQKTQQDVDRCVFYPFSGLRINLLAKREKKAIVKAAVVIA